MRLIQLFVLIAALSLASVATSAVDPACEGVTQAPTLDPFACP